VELNRKFFIRDLCSKESIFLVRYKIKFVGHRMAWTANTKFNRNLSSGFADETLDGWKLQVAWGTVLQYTPLLSSARNVPRPGNAS
jgi:hypothetical protein